MTKTLAPMAGLFNSTVLVVKFTLYMRGIRAVNKEMKPTTAEMRKYNAKGDFLFHNGDRIGGTIPNRIL